MVEVHIEEDSLVGYGGNEHDKIIFKDKLLIETIEMFLDPVKGKDFLLGLKEAYVLKKD